MLNLSNLLNIYSLWISSLNVIWNNINTPINAFLLDSASVLDNVFIPILTLFNLGDYTLLELMLGAGLGVYLAYQFVIWILNLVT